MADNEDWLATASQAIDGTTREDKVIDWVDAASAAIDRQKGGKRQAALVNAAGTNPDQNAQRMQQARQLGVQPSLLEDPAAAQRLRALQQSQALADMRDTPAVQKAFEDPTFAKVAHDDVEPLGFIERSVNALERGTVNTGLLFEAMGYKVDQAVTAVGGLFLPEPERYVEGTGPDDTEATTRGPGGVLVAAEAAAKIPQDAKTQELARRMAEIEARDGAAAAWLEGLVYTSNNPSILTNLLLEQIVPMAVTAPIGGIAASPVRQAVVSQIRNQAARQYANAVIPMAAVQFSTNYALDLGAEVPEGLQKGMTADEAIARANMKGLAEGGINALSAFLPLPGFTSARRAKRVAAVGGEALKQGAFGSLAATGAAYSVGEEISISEQFLEFFGELTTAPVDVATAYLIAPDVTDEARREAAGYIKDAARAQQAANIEQVMADLGEAVTASKLKARDPETFAKFIEEATKGAKVDAVYIDITQFDQALEQSGTDLQALLQASPDFTGQYVRARATGGDIKIPLNEYAAVIAGTDLHTALTEHARFHPEDMSATEARTWQDNQLGEFEQRAQKALQEAQDREALETQGQQVYDRIKSQLQAIEGVPQTTLGKLFNIRGQINTKTAEAYAALHKNVAIVLASRGVDPMAYYGALFAQGAGPVQPGESYSRMGQFGQPAIATAEDVSVLSESLKTDLPLKSLQLYLDNQKQLTLGVLVVDSDSRKQGVGSEAMRRIIDFADAKGLVVKLSPAIKDDYQGTTSRSRLVKFYKRFGFVENKGRNRDFSISESMYRLPARASLEQATPRGPRGKITFGGDMTTGPNVISLLENADLSTFLHESGHFFFELWRDLASQPDADPIFKDDMQALLDFIAVPDIDTWNAKTLGERREGHEKVARAFEAYLFEGKAPAPGLRKLFRTFARWLRQIYRELVNLDVTLTDDVRRVFDRMVATEDQIKATESAQGYTTLFRTAEEAGMTPEEFNEYRATRDLAEEDAVETLERQSLGDMKWLSNAKGRVLKRLQKAADSQREALRAEVAADIEQQPIYRALRYFKRGEMLDAEGTVQKVGMPHRLDIEALKGMYTDVADAPDWNSLGYGAYGALGKDGVAPDTAAELLGFTSGDELVRKLVAAQPFEEVVDGITEQRMIEEHGDLATPEDIERSANAALHNEARGRFVATEMRALAKMAKMRTVDQKAAKEFARASIARLKVRDLQPYQFELAEKRAAKASEKALRDGDVQQAAKYKQDQMVNFYLAKEAHKARTEIDKAIDYFKKFDSTGVRKNIDTEYIDQIDKLLERFDLRKGVSLRAIDKRESLNAWVEKQREMGLEPDLDPRLLDEANRTHYKNLPLDDLRELRDSVKQVEHFGRLKQKLLTARDQRQFAAIVDEIETSIRENANRTVKREIETRLPDQEDAALLSSWFAAHRKISSFIREMDGFKDAGPLWEYFGRPMNERGDFEAVEREKATMALSDLFKVYDALGEEVKKSLTNITRGRVEAVKPEVMQKQYIPAINRSLTKMARIVIALNWGNEDNRQRVMDGYGWSEGQAQAILDTLDKQDWDFVQSVWDFLESYWPAIEAKEKRITGVAPKKVAVSPVPTRYGEYRGGYYPIKYDSRQSPKSYANAAKEAAEQAMKGLYSRASTRRGHTKERTNGGGQKVRLDFGVMFEHVDQVVHDLAWHEWLVDANRLLGNRPIQEAIYDHYGPAVYKNMQDAVTSIAAGDVPAQTAFEKSINWLRTGTSIAGMGWSVWTSLLQPMGLTQSMVRIGPRWVGRGLARWVGSAPHMQRTVEGIFERSEFMRLRNKTMQREINEIRNKVMAGGVLSPVQDSFFYLITKAQMVADVPTWLGAYEKATVAGHTEETAVKLADQAVLDAQGGGQIKDLAQVQRGGPLMKLWTNFYSFFNTTLNLTAESYRRTNFTKPKDVGRFAVDMLLLYTLPATMSALMREALKGGCDGDEDCIMENVVRENLGYMAGTIIGVREMSGFVQGFYGYEGPAGTRFFSEVSKFGVQASQGEVDRAFLKAANSTAGILFHYPAAQVQRTADGLAAYMDGDTENPGALLFGPERK